MTIEIPGDPIACKRPRAARGRFYDSQFQAKENMRWYVKGNYPEQVQSREKGVPLEVIFSFWMPIPASWSDKKKKATLGTPHFKKPDLSNLIKFYEDALNGVLWDDDSHISCISAYKFYSDEPKTTITIMKSPR